MGHSKKSLALVWGGREMNRQNLKRPRVYLMREGGKQVRETTSAVTASDKGHWLLY